MSDSGGGAERTVGTRTRAGRLGRYIDQRTGLARVGRTALQKIFPNHWSFLLGEVALYSFLVLLLTGIFLTFFYDPSVAPVVYRGSYTPLRGVEVSQAYRSALDLSFDVKAGLVMRQMHHWAALIFLASILAHICRVFFTGAFRRPRELNWVVGVTLLLLAVLNGFAGYSLLDDQLSGTGLRIGYSVLISIPFAGPWLASLVFGGNFPGEDIIPRLFVVHVLIVPLAILGLIGVHMAFLIRHVHTQFAGRGARDDNVVGERLWPTYAFKAGGLFFLVAAVIALLGGIAQINPVWLYGPFRAENVSSGSQPDWYMGWLEGALRLLPNWETRIGNFTIPNPFYSGVLPAGIAFTLIYLHPWIEARLTGDRREHHVLDRPRDRPFRTGIGVAALTAFTVLGLAGSNDVIAVSFGMSVNALTYTFRVLLLIGPVIAFVVTHKLCRELQRRDGPVGDAYLVADPPRSNGTNGSEPVAADAETAGTHRD